MGKAGHAVADIMDKLDDLPLLPKLALNSKDSGGIDHLR
jgi:hypothetical protein